MPNHVTNLLTLNGEESKVKEALESVQYKEGEAEELELTDAQADRNDEIYEAAFEFCKVLTENPDLEWNMAFLGEIADLAASIMTRQGHKVRFPSVVTEQDGTQYIEEYYGD